MSPQADELLTPDEHGLVTLLGEAAVLYQKRVVANGRTREYDCAEFISRIHDLQHAVMAQAAARAYPHLYRVAGGTVSGSAT